MRQSSIILFIGLLIISINSKSFAQVDTLSNLTSKHWASLKDAHQKFLYTIINFCSITQVKLKFPVVTKELTDQSNTFLNTLNNVKSLDSSLAIKIDSLNYSLLKNIVTFFDKLQNEKSLLTQPRIRQEGEKVESKIKNVGRQIHDFNYWIYERNNINIKFRDVSL